MSSCSLCGRKECCGVGLEIEVEELKERVRWLECLEAAGVDNWEGIEMAIELMEDSDE